METVWIALGIMVIAFAPEELQSTPGIHAHRRGHYPADLEWIIRAAPPRVIQHSVMPATSGSPVNAL
jgi:hypothetical protein